MNDIVVKPEGFLFLSDFICRLDRCLAPSDTADRAALLAQEFDELATVPGLSISQVGVLRELKDWLGELGRIPDGVGADCRPETSENRSSAS